MKAVVTGAAGFLGSHVSEALVARGIDVTGVDNFDPFYSRSVKESNLAGLSVSSRFRLVEADIRDEGFGTLLDADTVVIHLAARAGVRPSIQNPLLYAAVNVEGTLRVLEAMRGAGARRLVFAGSSSVYGDTAPVPFREDWPAIEPISPYAATKRAAELMISAWVQLFRLRAISLRFFTVYGPRQRPDLAIHRFTRLISQGEPIPFYGDGSTERDYTWIDDIVQGVVAAVDWTAGPEPGFEIVNLGESETTRLDRLVELISGAIGRAAILDRQPMQPGDVVRTCADISRALELLGYRPQTKVATGIPRFVRWYEEAHGRQT